MKSNNIFKDLFILLSVLFFLGCSNSRKGKSDQPIDAATVNSMINSGSFVFIPQYVNHMAGRKRDLGSGFEISVSKDSIVSYLPYFGRGYIAHVSPAHVDFDFTCTNFTYTLSPANRGWNISIKPKDQKYLRELYFRIFDNASASLNITSVDRSFISYDGYITERKFKTPQKK